MQEINDGNQRIQKENVLVGISRPQKMQALLTFTIILSIALKIQDKGKMKLLLTSYKFLYRVPLSSASRLFACMN